MRNDPRYADNPLYQIRRLEHDHSLETESYALLFSQRDEQCADFLYERVAKQAHRFRRHVALRAVAEVSNECGLWCNFCARAEENRPLARFGLTPDETVGSLREAYAAGVRTFELRSGAGLPDDAAAAAVAAIRTAYPSCRIICSMCERGAGAFESLRAAGADAYILRFDCAGTGGYARLHAGNMSLRARLDRVGAIGGAGLRVGTGFLAGYPGANPKELAEAVSLTASFAPEYVDAPPFAPEAGSAFERRAASQLDLALFATGVLRLALPRADIVAGERYDALRSDGLELALLFGASSVTVRAGEGAAERVGELERRVKDAGMKLARG